MASLFSKIQVISLYRRLLRLHQKLPNKLSALGTVYIRSEFKRHRDVNDREIMRKFIKEWEVFANTLEDQLMSNDSILGNNLNDKVKEHLSDEQWGQLAELYHETTKYQK